MNSHIFKYELPIIAETIELRLPKRFKICDVNFQEDKIFIWAIIDVHSDLITRKFKIFGTGQLIENTENLSFLKTVHMPNGLVWNVFQD